MKENRRMYREKFDAVLPILRDVLNVDRPQASFYLWAGTSGPTPPSCATSTAAPA